MAIQSVCNDWTRQSHNSGPISQRVSFSAPCQHAIVSRIVVLLRACCPVAVFRRVAEVVISALDFVFLRRLLAHIFDEGLKTVVPARAYGNPASSVELEFGVFRVIAAASHAEPHQVFWRAGLPMCGGLGRGYIFPQTPAGLRVAASQRVGRDSEEVAAVATTGAHRQPQRRRSDGRGIGDGQSAVDVSVQFGAYSHPHILSFVGA